MDLSIRTIMNEADDGGAQGMIGSHSSPPLLAAHARKLWIQRREEHEASRHLRCGGSTGF